MSSAIGRGHSLGGRTRPKSAGLISVGLRITGRVGRGSAAVTGHEQPGTLSARIPLKRTLSRDHADDARGSGSCLRVAVHSSGRTFFDVGDGGVWRRAAGAATDVRSLREPNLCAYAQVNSAPNKKIWAE